MRCPELVTLLALPALVFLAGGAMAQAQQMARPILSAGLPDVTSVQTQATEKLGRPVQCSELATNRIDWCWIRHPAFLGSRRAGGSDARGATPCVVDRSGDPGLHRLFWKIPGRLLERGWSCVV